MLFSVAYYLVNAKRYQVYVVVYISCYFGVSSNKQLKQDMHTLMGKLKQQQQSSAAVSILLHFDLLAKL